MRLTIFNYYEIKTILELHRSIMTVFIGLHYKREVIK